MKSKKLFAILTLVAFMMTLVPMAAFAALDPTYSAAASTVSPSSTSLSVYADTDDLAKITVTFKGGAPVAALAEDTQVDLYVKADRDAVIGYVEGNAGPVPFDATLYGVSGQLFTNVPVKDGGKIHIYAGSGVSGSFKLSVYNGDPDAEGLLIGTTNIAVSVGDGAVSLTANNEDDLLGVFAEEAVAPYTTRAADAGDGVELTALVQDGGTAIEDVEVTFQAKYEGGSWYNIGTDVTDEDGEAKYYFEESKIGTYQYRAKTKDDTSGVIEFAVAALDTKTIELKTANGKKIAQKEVNNIDFYIKDKFGNLIKNFVAGDYAVVVSSAPAGSKFEDTEWTAGGFADATVSVAKMADGILRVAFEPDKEGKYTLKVRDVNETRVSAAIELEAIEFDEAVSMKLKVQNLSGKDATTLVRYYTTDGVGNDVNQVAGNLIVTLVNAAGVEISAPAGSELKFGSSDTSKVDFPDTTASGIRIKANAVGTYTLTAHYGDDNITASYELKVVGSPAALVATPAVTGLTAAVALQYVDAAGSNTWRLNANGTVKEDQYKIVLPAGVSSKNIKNIKDTGAGSFELVAEKAGKYAVTVITDAAITKTFEVEFAAAAKPVSKTVTMFLGAAAYMDGTAAKVSDVAPFIKDGRTFVAVRPVAEAFGAEIGWNEATKTVTLTRSDVTVTIVIGSNAITVVKGGVTSTVTADVAAFIKDGRTVLPFRAVGEAFGATVNYDAATQAVTYQL